MLLELQFKSFFVNLKVSIAVYKCRINDFMYCYRYVNVVFVYNVFTWSLVVLMRGLAPPPAKYRPIRADRCQARVSLDPCGITLHICSTLTTHNIERDLFTKLSPAPNTRFQKIESICEIVFDSLPIHYGVVAHTLFIKRNLNPESEKPCTHRGLPALFKDTNRIVVWNSSIAGWLMSALNATSRCCVVFDPWISPKFSVGTNSFPHFREMIPSSLGWVEISFFFVCLIKNELFACKVTQMGSKIKVSVSHTSRWWFTF